MHFLKRNLLPLSFALLVSVIAIAPQVLASHSLGSKYQGYPFMYQANEDFYMARAQEVIDGHPLLGSPVLNEYKDQWPPVMPFSEYVYAAPAMVLHVPLVYIELAYKFILPGVLFVLVYALTLLLLYDRSRLARLSAAGAGLAVTLGFDLVDYSHIWQLLVSPETHVLLWTRPVNPIIGELLLFVVLIVIYKTLFQNSKWLFVGAGVAFGIMISYIFSWLVAGAAVGLALLFALYQKNFFGALRLAGVLGIGFLIELPYWYHTLFAGKTAGHLVQLKNGAYFTHAPIINKFLLAATLVFVLCAAYDYYKKRNLKSFEQWWWFCALLLLAGWATFNEQVLTGMTIWPYHIVQFTIPLSFVALFVLGYNYITPKVKYLWEGVLVCAVVLSLAVGLSSAHSYVYKLADFETRQSYMPVFAWLNQNAQPDCAVLVSESQENLAMLVPAFTHCNTYITTYVNFNVPDERVLHNALVVLRLRGITPQNARAYFEANPSQINGYFYSTIDQALFPGINDETKKNIDTVVAAYPAFYRSNFNVALKKYKIDYFLDTSSYPLPRDLNVHKVESSGALTLYTVQ